MNIQNELKAPKSQFNKFGNYKYRNTEDILEALKPLLSSHKAIINVSDEIELIGDRYYVKATARLIDVEEGNQEIKSTAYARESLERKGMDLSQLTGSTSSYARKYALNGLFAIDDTKDSDYTNQTNIKGTSKNKDNKRNNESNLASPKQIELITNLAKRKNYEFEKITEYIKKEFEKNSSKELTKQEASKLIEMLNRLGK